MLCTFPSSQCQPSGTLVVLHSIMKNSNAESCTANSKMRQGGMQSLRFAVRKTKMERGYNSPKYHAAGQWWDRNRTLEPDSWALLCLLITLSSTVPSISIDFKLTHTHILSRRKKNSQEGSLCSAPLEANMILRANIFCKQPCPKTFQAGRHKAGTVKELSNAYKMLQPSWAAFQKTQSTIMTCLKCRKETLQMQMLLLLYLTRHLTPYHLIFWCQDLRVNPSWPSLTMPSNFMLALSSSLPMMS